MGGRGPGGGPAASGRGAVPEPQRVRRADAGMGASMADAGFDPNAMSEHPLAKASKPTTDCWSVGATVLKARLFLCFQTCQAAVLNTFMKRGPLNRILVLIILSWTSDYPFLTEGETKENMVYPF